MLKRKFDFLIVGHPRGGTRYISNLLCNFGLNIGHEYIGSDGMSCWFGLDGELINKSSFLELNENGEKHWKPKHYGDIQYSFLIHIVRNPFRSLPSIMFNENLSKNSVLLRHKVTNFDDQKTIIDKAAISYLGWHNHIVARNPDFTFRIEDDSKVLFDYVQICSSKDLTYQKYTNNRDNTRKHRYFTKSEIQEMNFDIFKSLYNFGIDVGYSEQDLKYEMLRG